MPTREPPPLRVHGVVTWRVWSGIVAKYRKKPVVIDAWKIEPAIQEGDLAQAVVDGKLKYCEDGSVLIATLEGTMQGFPGDWIICGVNGEYYPCKPDVFAKTYVEDTPEIRERLQAACDVKPCGTMQAGWRSLRLFVIKKKHEQQFWCCSSEHGCGWNDGVPKQAFSPSELAKEIRRLIDEGWWNDIIVSELHVRD